MKKLIAVILCAVMLISLLPMSAFAASGTLVREEELARDLKALGIFKGVSETDFALDRAPTRTEALVMLIRVLGRENEALSKGGRHPFLDVPQWADKYVGYAYENNLTNGVSATKFGSNSVASASMYITFVLRALGYSDSNGDFTWDNPFALARQTGIMSGNPDIMKFLRADVVLVSYAALEAQIKGTRKTLAQKLIEANVFTAEAYDRYYNVSEFENEGMSKTLTAEEIYAKCSPAVFYIEVYDQSGKPFAMGSGFFIDSDGTAVTNYHVIEGASSAKIRLSDSGKVHRIESVYDYSAEEDWAVVKVSGKDFPYLEIEKEEAVRGGQVVYAIGSPQGLENTISEGLVSNPNRIIGDAQYIQISVPISQGSSGGALINQSGKVVGITSAIWSEGQNLNLARPISVIDGYKSEKDPHDYTGQFENSHLTVGDIDTSGMTSAEAAGVLLKSWIANNSNATLDGKLAYYEERSSNGGVETAAIAYDDGSDSFVVISSFYFESGANCTGYIAFTPEEDSVLARYEYYPPKSEIATVAETVVLTKKDFNDDITVSFDSYWGEERQMHEENAAASAYNSLLFAEQIMRRNLAGYGVRGVSDFGFVYF